MVVDGLGVASGEIYILTNSDFVLDNGWVMNNCMPASEMILHTCTLDILLWLNWTGQNEEPYEARIASWEEISIIWVRLA